MPGGRLTSADREEIASGLAGGLSYAQIGERLRRPASTIMREVARNGGRELYSSDRAEKATRARASRRTPTSPRAVSSPASVSGRDPAGVDEFEAFFTALLIRQGLPRMAARVMAALQLEDAGTLTAAELMHRLGVSAASISNAVAFLERQGMVAREREADGRRDRYLIDDRFGERVLSASLEMNEVMTDAVRRGTAVLGADTPAGARFAQAALLMGVVSDALKQALDTWEQTRASAGN